MFREKQEGLNNQNFKYLDFFENQMREHRKAQNEFYNTMKKEEEDHDSKVPAFFRKQESKSSDQMNENEGGLRLSRKAEDMRAWQNLQKQMEMDFDPETKSQEELREFFKISKEKNAIDHMNEQVFEYLYERMRERQIRFYAFLNKEFNIMNYKSARCSYHCFDSTDKPLRQVNDCLSLCREGLNGCRDFALKLQTNAEEEVQKCQNEAQTLRKQNQNLTDPIIHWISCYEKLILRFDSMENEIKDEFSNFI